MTAKPIWVVEQGEYSDYRVVGVFTSEQNAQTVADAIGCDASVAQWPLDPAVAELNQGHKQFVVHMHRDGKVESCRKWDISSYNIAGSFTIWERSKAPAYRGQGLDDLLQATVWASDKKHAVKITNEKRVQMIASNAWVESR